MPRVSVLIPVYRTEEAHLRAAIESILSQSFKDFELLLLNDAPDDTRPEAVAASYGDARIRYICNERNLGITPSRNKLIELAQGDYLAVMDHDDLSLPTRLEKQVAYMDAHPEVGVCGARVQNFGESNKVSTYPLSSREIKLGLMDGCMVPHSCAMIRRELLERTGIRYEEAYSPAEDYALWCRLMPHTEFCNLPEVLLHYRLYAGNTSKKAAERMAGAAAAIRAFVRTENAALYREFLLRGRHATTVRLFGCLPFLKIVGSAYVRTVYLFDVIPLFSWKHTVKMRG